MSESIRIRIDHKGYNSFGLYWAADTEKPVANIIIMTGMEEHASRYDDFAKFLNKNGYNVYSIDAYGQGENVLPDMSNLGIWPRSGFRRQVTINDKLVRMLRVTCLPCYIFAHSMGSFMAQDFIQRYALHVDKVVLCGSNKQSPFMMAIGYGLARILVRDSNRNKKAKFLNSLMFGGLSKSVKNAKTPYDWLSYNEENVNKYIADPLCGFGPNNGFCLEFIKGMNRLYKHRFLEKIKKDIELFIISGDADPVSNMGKGVLKLEKMYKKYHLKNVKTKIYPNMRHEILNEVDHQIVYDDILNFFKGEAQE